MQVGVELAEARRRLGLSLEEVSRRTKISVERLSAIERGDLDHLPALVYLNGFLRAYADEVHLDSADVTGRYLDELAKPTDAESLEAIGIADVANDRGGPASDAVAEPAPEHALNEFAAEDRPAPAKATEAEDFAASLPPAVSMATTPPDAAADVIPEPAPPEPPAPRRTLITVPANYDPELFAPAYARSSANQASFAPVFYATTAAEPRRRYGAILLVLVLAGAVGALFSANSEWLLSANTEWLPPEVRERLANLGLSRSDAPRESPSTLDEPVQPEAVSRDEPAETEPTGPSLDARRTADPARARTPAIPASEPARANPPAVAALGRDARPAPPERVVNRTPAVETPEVTRTAPAVSSRPVTVAADPDDLSGWWTLTNRVESTSHEAFDNLNLGYRLRLEQQGNRVSGMGQKWMENGRALPPTRRTPITLEGTRDGRRLELHFTENGALRASSGTFVMELEDDGTLHGRFMSDAANSQGSSLARRESAPRD